MEVFIIKIKVKGYLENITENQKDLIDTNAIQNSNIISYVLENTKYKIITEKNKITILRENEEFSHGMIFEENKTNKSEYYLKKENYSLEFNILTTKLNINKNKIDITYKIIESENIYNYVLESSDIL